MRERMNTMEKQMLVYEGSEELVSYEEEMLRNNRIPGLLPMEILIRAGKKQYRYDVTGMHSYEEILQSRSLSGEELQQLLVQMHQVIHCAKEYLLLEDNFVLSPESIYEGRDGNGVWLCYYPGYAIPVREQLRTLSEWILEHLEIEDAKAVYCGYAMHVLCREGNTSFSALLELFEGEEWKRQEKEEVTKEAEFSAEVVEAETKEPKKGAAGIWTRIKDHLVEASILLAFLFGVMYMIL